METYETNDTPLAAFLRCNNLPQVGERIDEHGRAWFVFEHPDTCGELASEYGAGHSSVEPKEYATQLRYLRRLAKEMHNRAVKAD